jgi:hypothetical protein
MGASVCDSLLTSVGGCAGTFNRRAIHSYDPEMRKEMKMRKENEMMKN